MGICWDTYIDHQHRQSDCESQCTSTRPRSQLVDRAEKKSMNLVDCLLLLNFCLLSSSRGTQTKLTRKHLTYEKGCIGCILLLILSLCYCYDALTSHILYSNLLHLHASAPLHSNVFSVFKSQHSNSIKLLGLGPL